jgi:hypothetical protein
MMTETQTLALTIERTREYARYYLKHLKDADPHREFTVEGVTLNTQYWLTAHLTSTQNWLLLRATGGPFEKFSWAKYFNLGSTPPARELCPPYEEVKAMFKAIHEKAVAHVTTLTDEQLGQPHAAMMKLGGQDSVRDVILHHIRHEALHTGQLAWLCKLQGIKTM